MNARLARTLSIIVLISIVSSTLSIFTMSAVLRQKAITREVVTIRQTVLVTEAKRITLFIDELLLPKSAKCFRKLLHKESRLDPNAKNSKSSAKGVGQLLDSTYRNIGLRHSDDALAQVIASMAYISRRYNGNFCAAWNHSRIHNFY